MTTILNPGRTRRTGRPPTGTDRPALRRVLGYGVAGTMAGALVLTGYGAIALAAHGPMRAGDPGAAHATAIHPPSFASGVLACGVIATVLAALIARRAARPARSFTLTATALTMLSLVAPLAATHTTEATRLLLALGHLIAAGLVIPILARSLSRNPAHDSVHRTDRGPAQDGQAVDTHRPDGGSPS